MWLAFYSEKQKMNIEKMNNYKTYASNFYKLANSNKVVEVTEVVKCNTIVNNKFDDTIYLGLVDKWVSVGK